MIFYLHNNNKKVKRNKGRQCQHAHLDLVLLDVTFETCERFSFVFVNICV